MCKIRSLLRCHLTPPSYMSTIHETFKTRHWPPHEYIKCRTTTYIQKTMTFLSIKTSLTHQLRNPYLILNHPWGCFNFSIPRLEAKHYISLKNGATMIQLSWNFLGATFNQSGDNVQWNHITLKFKTCIHFLNFMNS